MAQGSDEGQAKISVLVRELINVGNYSNVTLEASAERYVTDDDASVKAGYEKTYQQVEDVLRERRGQILSAIGKQS